MNQQSSAFILLFEMQDLKDAAFQEHSSFRSYSVITRLLSFSSLIIVSFPSWLQTHCSLTIPTLSCCNLVVTLKIWFLLLLLQSVLFEPCVSLSTQPMLLFFLPWNVLPWIQSLTTICMPSFLLYFFYLHHSFWRVLRTSSRLVKGYISIEFTILFS